MPTKPLIIRRWRTPQIDEYRKKISECANHHKIKYTVAGAMWGELNDNEIYAKEQRL